MTLAFPHKGTNTPSLPLPEFLSFPAFPINLGTASATVYSVLYLLLEPVAGGLLLPLILGGTAFANYLTTTYGATANIWALGLFVASWIAQFVGHGVYEGRAPALLDNLIQALFLAPFFVWMEVLFFFGYRPELKSRLKAEVEKEIATFKSSKKTVGTGSGHVNDPANDLVNSIRG